MSKASTNNNWALASIKQFDGDPLNWSTFKKDIEVYCDGIEGILDVISPPHPSEPTPASSTSSTETTQASTTTSTTKRSSEEHKAADRRGYALIYFLLAPEQRHLIAEVTTGSEAWRILLAEFEKDAPANRLSLRAEFLGATHDVSENIDAWISKIMSISRRLRAIGYPPSDKEISDILLLRLDPSFAAARAAIVSREKEATLKEMVAALKEFEAQERLANEPVVDMSANAAKLKSKHKLPKNIDWGNSKSAKDVCFRCGVPGHFAPECVLDMPRDVKERILKELKKKRKSSEEKSGTENAAISWRHINDDGDISGSSDSEELAAIADFVGFIGAETTPGLRKASASSLTKRGRTMHPLKSTPPSTSISDSSQNSSNVSVIQGSH